MYREPLTASILIDLGVNFEKNRGWSGHISNKVGVACRMSFCILRTLRTRHQGLILLVFSSFLTATHQILLPPVVFPYKINHLEN